MERQTAPKALFGKPRSTKRRVFVGTALILALLIPLGQHWVLSSREYGSPLHIGLAALELGRTHQKVVPVDLQKGRYILRSRNGVEELCEHMRMKGWYLSEQMGGLFEFQNCPHIKASCACEGKRRISGSIGMCTSFFMVFCLDSSSGS